MFAVAFIVTLLTFFQLRVADEHKDAEFDRRHHPSRPVPRGLVSLDELKMLAFAGAITQFIAATSLGPLLTIPLIATWLYLGLMTREFFCAEWLRENQILYVVSHMCILFFTDFFITACHWMSVGEEPPLALGLFLATSFFLGLVIEVGRKIRSPEEESDAGDTYTKLWGRTTAIRVWVAAISISAVLASLTAAQVGYGQLSLILLTVPFAAVVIAATKFIQSSTSNRAKRIDTVSGVWILATYLIVGVMPLSLTLLR